MIDTTPSVAVDFDGVIARYDGWQGPDTIGDPVPGALAALELLAKIDANVVVYSTRPARPIRDWLRHRGAIQHVDEIDGTKRFYTALLDDRARHVPRNRSGGLLELVGAMLDGGQIR